MAILQKRTNGPGSSNALAKKLLLAVLCCGSVATAFADKASVGPYYLGMPAAEARKAGITNCRPWADLTKCEATYGPLENLVSFSVFLNSKQLVNQVELKTEQIYSRRVPGNYKPPIDVAVCPPGFQDRDSCFYPPDKLVTKETSISSSYKTLDGYIRTTITAEVNRAQVAAFLREKESRERAQRQAKAIQLYAVNEPRP